MALGETHSPYGTPRNRALRLMYMKANRNRYRNPEGLVKAATMAEEAGFNPTGSQPQSEVDYRKAEAAETLRQVNALQRQARAGMTGSPMRSSIDTAKRRLAANSGNKDQTKTGVMESAYPGSAVSPSMGGEDGDGMDGDEGVRGNTGDPGPLGAAASEFVGPPQWPLFDAPDQVADNVSRATPQGPPAPSFGQYADRKYLKPMRGALQASLPQGPPAPSFGQYMDRRFGAPIRRALQAVLPQGPPAPPEKPVESGVGSYLADQGRRMTAAARGAMEPSGPPAPEPKPPTGPRTIGADEAIPAGFVEVGIGRGGRRIIEPGTPQKPDANLPKRYEEWKRKRAEAFRPYQTRVADQQAAVERAARAREVSPEAAQEQFFGAQNRARDAAIGRNVLPEDADRIAADRMRQRKFIESYVKRRKAEADRMRTYGYTS